MTPKRQCEFYLLRYVPNVVTGQFVNVGVLMLQSDAGFADFRLTRDWRVARCMEPDVDVEMFEALGRELQARLADVRDRYGLMKAFGDSLSGVVQLSGVTIVSTDDPEKEIELLASIYLETKHSPMKRGASEKQRIYVGMRTEFERTGVWPHMLQGIAVEKYTHKGDPLKIDCGYRPNGELKLFHAVPLASDVNAAKVLAFSYPKIAEGIQKGLNASTRLTAVVEDNLDIENEALAFAYAILEQSGIQILGVGQMGQVAELARKELKL